jgi:catechol 2,3-dioxygenase-like lactoylglutathione lyase family enzyme
MQNDDLAIPTLPCRSIGAATEFYRRLGFQGGAHEFNPEYGIFKRGAVELHFFTHRELLPTESSAGCYIRVVEVESLYKVCSALGLPSSGIPRIDRLEDKPWGIREFAIVDPDGNLLRIGQVING